MQQPKLGRAWYFVDEAGDPTFYNRRGRLVVGQEGCSPLLILGFIQTADPEPIRKAVRGLHEQVLKDPYFQGHRSLKETAIAFHANNDLFEIKYLFFKLIATLDFRAHFIVARKDEQLFINYSNRNQDVFYDHVVSCLFESVLHLREENHIYFARRGKVRQAPLVAAIERSHERFQKYRGICNQTQFTVQAQQPSHEPCLCVIDYLNWALYEAYTKGKMNYFNEIRDKVSLVADIYDKQVLHHPWYHRRNPFDITKVTPLSLVPS